MSYSDYGGFVWRNGERYLHGEDYTPRQKIEAPKERPLEALTGMKFDVLINADVPAEEGQEYDFTIDHPNHVVLGEYGNGGPLLCGYKQGFRIILPSGDRLRFPSYDDDFDMEKEELIWGTPSDDWMFALKYIEYPHSNGCMALLRWPDGTIDTAIVGYGIGHHWWKEDDGREHRRTGELYDLRVGEWFWSSEADEADCERHGVESGERLGYKHNRRWATEEEFESMVVKWSKRILK